MWRSLVILLAFAATANAQVKIEGPKEGTVGYRTKAKLTLDVDDPKLVCFPANDDWMAIQDFAGNKYIDFVPGKKTLTGVKSKLFTFVVAGNKGGKTFLETWEVTIVPDEEVIPVPPPAPPKPVDDITKTDLYKSVLAAYKVFPDAAAKTKLVNVYAAFLSAVEADKYTSNGQAHESLVAFVKGQLPNGELQGVKDAVAAYLVANTGQSKVAWDKAKLTTAMTKVIAAVTAIPE